MLSIRTCKLSKGRRFGLERQQLAPNHTQIPLLLRFETVKRTRGSQSRGHVFEAWKERTLLLFPSTIASSLAYAQVYLSSKLFPSDLLTAFQCLSILYFSLSLFPSLFILLYFSLSYFLSLSVFLTL